MTTPNETDISYEKMTSKDLEKLLRDAHAERAMVISEIIVDGLFWVINHVKAAFAGLRRLVSGHRHSTHAGA